MAVTIEAKGHKVTIKGGKDANVLGNGHVTIQGRNVYHRPNGGGKGSEATVPPGDGMFTAKLRDGKLELRKQ